MYDTYIFSYNILFYGVEKIMTAFIIDTYNKFDIFDREHSRYVFEINGNMYAIKEVYMKWGRPKLPLRIGAEKD